MNLEDEILIYPGADEVGMVLIARMINKINDIKPKIYVEYATKKGHLFVPMFEDREIYKTIALQIKSSGCQLCDDINMADGILMFNTPTLDLDDANITEGQCDVLTGEERDIKSFVKRIKAYIDINKRVSIADVAKINRGDKELVSQLCNEDIYFSLAGYSGWNTSSNTLGTALAHLVINIHCGFTNALQKHLALRVYEDIGYMHHARSYVLNTYMPQLNLNYFDSGTIKGEVSGMVWAEVSNYIKNNYNCQTLIFFRLCVIMNMSRKLA